SHPWLPTTVDSCFVNNRPRQRGSTYSRQRVPQFHPCALRYLYRDRGLYKPSPLSLATERPYFGRYSCGPSTWYREHTRRAKSHETRCVCRLSDQTSFAIREGIWQSDARQGRTQPRHKQNFQWPRHKQNFQWPNRYIKTCQPRVSLQPGHRNWIFTFWSI